MGAVKEFQLGDFRISGTPSDRGIATAINVCSYLGDVAEMSANVVRASADSLGRRHAPVLDHFVKRGWRHADLERRILSVHPARQKVCDILRIFRPLLLSEVPRPTLAHHAILPLVSAARPRSTASSILRVSCSSSSSDGGPHLWFACSRERKATFSCR